MLNCISSVRREGPLPAIFSASSLCLCIIIFPYLISLPSFIRFSLEFDRCILVTEYPTDFPPPLQSVPSYSFCCAYFSNDHFVMVKRPTPPLQIPYFLHSNIHLVFDDLIYFQILLTFPLISWAFSLISSMPFVFLLLPFVNLHIFISSPHVLNSSHNSWNSRAFAISICHFATRPLPLTFFSLCYAFLRASLTSSLISCAFFSLLLPLNIFYYHLSQLSCPPCYSLLSTCSFLF